MKNKYKVGIGICCWLLFSMILAGVINQATWVSKVDAIGYTLTQPTTQVKTAALTEITFLGDPVTVMIVTVGMMLLLWRRRQSTNSVWYGMLQFIGYCLVILIKYSVVRVRPSQRLINVNGYSFPSGHTFATTIFTFTIITLVCHLIKKDWSKIVITILGLVWIIIIMYSRVYLRAHYATDVLAGFFLASGWWFIIGSLRYYFFHWLWKPVVKQLSK